MHLPFVLVLGASLPRASFSSSSLHHIEHVESYHIEHEDTHTQVRHTESRETQTKGDAMVASPPSDSHAFRCATRLIHLHTCSMHMCLPSQHTFSTHARGEGILSHVSYPHASQRMRVYAGMQQPFPAHMQLTIRALGETHHVDLHLMAELKVRGYMQRCNT